MRTCFCEVRVGGGGGGGGGPPPHREATAPHVLRGVRARGAGARDDDRTGHGTAFQAIMNVRGLVVGAGCAALASPNSAMPAPRTQQINTSTVPDHQRPPGGYGISITHTMFDEVEFYQQHHWRCERCGSVVKRAMNRRPQDADCRCGVPHRIALAARVCLPTHAPTTLAGCAGAARAAAPTARTATAAGTCTCGTAAASL